MNRQKAWQHKQVNAGRCHKCGKKRDCKSISSCFSCLKKARVAHKPQAAWHPGGAGRVPFEKTQQYKKLRQKRLKRARKLADMGHTRKQIAVILRCSVSYLIALLREVTKTYWKWAWWRHKNRQKDVKRLIVMYKAGVSTAIIRKTFNITSFYRLLREQGVTIRKRGRPRKS